MSTPSRCVTAGLLAALMVAAMTAMMRAGIYGYTVFLLFPAMIGGLAAWVFRPATGSHAAFVGAAAAAAGSGLLLVLGFEGLICIAMCLPLSLPLGALGGWLVYLGGLPPERGIALLLLPAAAFTWDTLAVPVMFKVHSEIRIAAPPEQVWRHVVAFPDLPEPHEWYFHTGLAYPKRARIEGSGAGATRYCEFSTGAFVEPVEIWNPPHLLRFRVTQNPAPMQEWSPYGPILPKHLHGYLVSKQGEFRLSRQADGGTLLEGTTWYSHGLWPAQYWRWWSDAIIHRIHLRVLNHIRLLAEQQDAR